LKKRPLLIALASVAALAVIIFAIILSRQRLQRHRVFRVAPPEKPAAAPAQGIPPVEQWTDTFRRLPPDRLVELLEDIEQKQPDLYRRWPLAYLHARALIEDDQPRAAAQKLAPFLAPGNPLRDLALFHQAEIDEARNEPALASRSRSALIFDYPKAAYRDEAIEDETAYIASTGDAKRLIDFAAKLFPKADTKQRRDLVATIVETELRAGNSGDALTRGLALLSGGTTDDPSDRVSRAIDRAELVARMTPQQKATLGESMQNHRHFDRAVALLGAALAALPQRRDEFLFAIGRSWYGDEKYAQARDTYLRGAAATADPKAKSMFLWHAARAAQLLGDDKGAEKLMTDAIAVPGRFPATTAALTQRIRTRLKQGRAGEAAADLNLLRKLAPNDHAIAEGSLAWAISPCCAPRRRRTSPGSRASGWRRRRWPRSWPRSCPSATRRWRIS
jgi:tetratricopeptide (TPR) repeat protein